MKFITLLLFFIQFTYADMPAKIWTITQQNNIESTEDDFVPPAVDEQADYADISQEDTLVVDEPALKQSDLEELPLAKTYPLEQSEQITNDTSKLVHVADASLVLSKDDLAKRVQEIQSVIQQSVPKVSKEEKIEQKTKPTIQKTVPKHDQIMPKLSTHKQSTNSFYSEFIQNRTQIMVALFVGIFILLFLLYLLIRSPKKKKVTIDYSKSEIDDIAAVILERYTNFKGQMHKAFLQRKENIFFHDEFTPYQRAKSTLELEKEYNDLEHIYLPKLFSNDVEKFVNGVEMIACKPELKGMLQDFASQMIEAGRFTKREKAYLEQKITSFYNTAPQMPQNAQAAVPDKETAYFLQ